MAGVKVLGVDGSEYDRPLSFSVVRETLHQIILPLKNADVAIDMDSAQS